MRRTWAFALLLAACDGGSEAQPTGGPTGLLPVAACAECHPRQADALVGSPMHYATFSPVANAMMRVLEDKHPEFFAPDAAGSFCGDCHAPAGRTRGVAQAPGTPGFLRDRSAAPGDDAVTCDVCHTVAAAPEPAALPDPNPSATRFGPFGDPVPNDLHDSQIGAHISDARLCGGCHDVRIPRPDVVTGEPFGRLEDLFSEWARSPWADATHPQNPLRGQPGITGLHGPDRIAAGEVVTCADCHMSLYPARGFADPIDADLFDDVDPAELTRKAHKLYAAGRSADVDGAPVRRIADHHMTAASSPLVPWPPNADRADVNLERRTAMLRAAATLHVEPVPAVAPGESLQVDAWIENVGAGHNVPAGFSQEREVWVAIRVLDEGRRCAADTDCADLRQPPRDLDGTVPRCLPDDPVVAPDDATSRAARARAERSGLCDTEAGRCVVYRSGYLVDGDGDGRTDDEDLRHVLVDLDPDTLDERCVLPGPDADRRPDGIEEGLVHFTNQLQRLATDANGAPMADPRARHLEPTAAPHVPAPDAAPVLDQDPADRRTAYATQRARFEMRRWQPVLHRDRPPHRAITDPLDANHFFNGNALRPFEPRLARYRVPLPEATRGPLRVDVRLRFRFFPPRVLRALAARHPELLSEADIDRALRIVDMATATVEIPVVPGR
jgi:hypothetical protein